MVMAIDPGTVVSAWIVIENDYKPHLFDIADNDKLLCFIRRLELELVDTITIEKIASNGMAVGATVFETCEWTGRFREAFESRGGIVVPTLRKDIKMNLCGSMRARDSNIRQALIDRFGVVGTKKSPGWFYKFKKDIWAAYACGVTFLDHEKGVS